MLIDDVASVLASSVTEAKAIPLEDGLFLPSGKAGAVRGVLFPRVGRHEVQPAHDLALSFLSLIPAAGVLAMENVPTREGGQGSLLLHAIGDWEVARAKRFWDSTGGQPVWMESRIGGMRRAWLSSSAPDRLRIFEAHLHDGADVVSILPYATDVVWDRNGAPMRTVHDPLDVMPAYAKREAMMLSGSPEVTDETWAALTREADLVLMMSAAMTFPTTRIDEVGTRPTHAGRWRRVVKLGRDAELDAARKMVGMPAWDEHPLGKLN